MRLIPRLSGKYEFGHIFLWTEINPSGTVITHTFSDTKRIINESMVTIQAMNRTNVLDKQTKYLKLKTETKDFPFYCISECPREEFCSVLEF